VLLVSKGGDLIPEYSRGGRYGLLRPEDAQESDGTAFA